MTKRQDRLPDRVLSFYGDDFTGSSALMEVTAFAGLPTVMFLEPPSPERLEEFSEHRCFGIAGTARARDPEWMSAELPAAFEALRSLGAAVNVYKICSTFDSSPETGSIGRATEIGVEVFGPRFVPLLTAALPNNRFQAFGNLFVVHGDGMHRLDRHPVMSRHPSTPMDEGDLGRHLARQTDLPVGLVDLAAMKAGRGSEVLARARAEGARIVSMDVIDSETLEEAGRLIWDEARERPLFAVGSQGLAQACVAHWQRAGLLDAAPKPPPPARVERIAAVSGSVAVTTAEQIAHAAESGFEVIQVDATQALDERAWAGEAERAVGKALRALEAGASPLICTARGPEDPAVATFRSALALSAAPGGPAHARLGQGLGEILNSILGRSDIKRAVISGGDSSSFAAASLGVYALSAIAPIAPGAPLCYARALDPAIGGFELTLKGGQIGGPDFFTRVRDGGDG